MPNITDGKYYLFNLKRFFVMNTAIVGNSTNVPTEAVIGSVGTTKHATGMDQIYVSDGVKWQVRTAGGSGGGGMAIGGAITSATEGSILYAGVGGVLSQIPQLYFDASNIRLKLLDKTYDPGAVKQYLSIATNTRYSIPDTDGLTGLESRLPVTINGTNKTYVGLKTYLDVQGSPINPTIMGHYITIASNATYPAGTGTAYGQYILVDVGAQLAKAVGSYVSAVSSGSGASGLAEIVALHAVCSIAHNGNTTKAFGGDFQLTSSLSSPSVVTLATALRARATLRPGITVNELRGLSITDLTTNTFAGYPDPIVDNSSYIYADSSFDIGITTKYFIKSLSTSRSEFAGPIAVPADPYSSTWTSDPVKAAEVPTKGDLYTKFESKIAFTNRTSGGLPTMPEPVEVVGFTTFAATGYTDLYTVPAGKKAVIAQAMVQNFTGGTLTSFWGDKIASTYQRVGGKSGTLTNFVVQTPLRFFFEAGETIAYNINVLGARIWYKIWLFDDTFPAKTIRLFNAPAAITLMYQVPAGKKASMMPLDIFPFLSIGNSTVSRWSVVNESVGAVTCNGYLVPSGEVQDATHKSNGAGGFNVNAGSMNTLNSPPYFARAGDAIYFETNVSTDVSVYLNLYEENV